MITETSGPICRVLRSGLGASFQDLGRPGWRRFGVPPGGAMDLHAAVRANRLVGNPDDAPVIELTLQGAEFEVLESTWFAVTGADTGGTLPAWTAAPLAAGTRLHFPQSRSGIWSYLAVLGGWVAPSWFKSASVYERAGLGQPLSSDDILAARPAGNPFGHLASRSMEPSERRDYLSPPVLELLPGPQFDLFSAEAKELLVSSPWKISARSDRTGYRLEGPSLGQVPEITSEPVLPGSFQVPGNGQPLVTMPDGPTVGGYAKIALLRDEDRDWLTQCRPGSTIHFRWTGA